jgi:ribonuclease HI
MRDVVKIHTDGACRGNPGPGGWGVVMEYGIRRKTLHGGAAHTTNNRMELTAVIMALQALTRPCLVHLYSDSRYVLQGITEWLPVWKSKGWKTAARKPVLNADLWQALELAAAKHTIEWHWVKGHSGHSENDAADQLANRGIDELPLAAAGD